MDKVLGFIRTTLVGGLLYLVPIVILIIVLGKAMSIAHKVAPAFSGVIAELQLADILTPRLFAVMLLIVFCFAAGLFSRTALAKSIGSFLDSKVLINIPGYGLLRSMGGGSEGIESFAHRPVLVSIEDAWQIAFVVDKLDDGSLAVYVPGVPEARSGSLYFMTSDRVRPLEIPASAAFQALRRMGVGSNQLFKGKLNTG